MGLRKLYPHPLTHNWSKLFRWSQSDPLDTNRFRWKISFSIPERLRMIPLMLDEGVESRSDGVHRIHWKRIDYKPYENFNIPPSPHPGYLTHYFVVNCELI